MNYTYILLKQNDITMKNIKFDISVAAYILNPTDGKYPIDKIIENYLDINTESFLKSKGVEESQSQMTLFEVQENFSRFSHRTQKGHKIYKKDMR